MQTLGRKEKTLKKVKKKTLKKVKKYLKHVKKRNFKKMRKYKYDKHIAQIEKIIGLYKPPFLPLKHLCEKI